MREHRKIIKTVAAGLILALTCSMIPVQNLKATPTGFAENTTEESGPRPEAEVIKIHTLEDFMAFAKQCSLDSWSVNKWIILEADINLSDTDFEMIPIFGGVFDGNGHTISGFHSVGDGYVGGLFRYISQSGVVKNLQLKGSIAGTEEKECIGSICGVNYGAIRNCSFMGTISGRDTVGGIAGTNAATGFIDSCNIRGHVTGYYMTGGIAGANHGYVNGCSNYSGINNDSEWVEEDDGMETGLLPAIRNSDSDIEFFSGVDTGGIAGYSDGTISNCFNYGKIGYEHSGYNIGGIAGRQAGVVSFCENTGEIYGRKDVGGIVGQMEPSIAVNEAESLRNAVNKLHDLIGRTLDDMQDGKNAAKADLDSLDSYGDAALNSGRELADQLSDFTNSNMEQVREVNARMDYVMSQLPDVVEDLSAAGEAFGRFCDTLGQVIKEADTDIEDLPNINDKDSENSESSEQKNPSDTVEILQKDAGQLNHSSNKIRKLITNTDGSAKEWNDLNDRQQETLISEITTLADASQETKETAEKALSELTRIDVGTPSNEGQQNTDDAIDALQDMADSLKNAANRTRNIVNYLNAQPDISFTALGGEFNQSRENLHGQIQGIAESLKKLSQNASAYSDLINADLNAVNDQLNVVFHLLVDNLSGATELSVEELYEEVSDDEIDSIATGKTDSCTNKGIVKGDINIGGITGSMAIDEEDPEDNAAGSIDYEIGRRFIMRCIIRNCVNEGYITAKKDGAGGIAGYMAHGIVIDSKGCGTVESTEGNYVGGICGESLTIIRRCFSLCDVSGCKNIGGIAGYANTLKDCYAIVNVEASAGRKGAIAGEVSEAILGPLETEESIETNVCRNYYVDDTLYGIDSISYLGIAEPVSYQELLAVEGIPSEFRHLKVIYMADDMYLGSEEVAFGASLANLHYPEFPARQGYYGVWPDLSNETMSGNLVVHGEYHDIVRVVESKETDKPYALVEQSFTENTVLNVSISNMNPPQQAAGETYVMYDVSLENSSIENATSFPVRLLNPYEKAQVWGWSNGQWTQLESKIRGSYLQVNMTGSQEVFCIVKKESYTLIIVVCVAGAALLFLLLTLLIKSLGKKKPLKRR